jgi:hypothetical protein
MGLTDGEGSPLIDSGDGVRTVDSHGQDRGHGGRCGSALMKEVVSLLKWSMLAATTVGPGTVVVCAKVGERTRAVIMRK